MTKRQVTIKALCDEMGWDFNEVGHKISNQNGLSIERMEEILDRLQK